MSAVPVRKRQREEQVVPTFDTPLEGDGGVTGGALEDGVFASPGVGASSLVGGIQASSGCDYPIPNFEALYAEMRHPERGLKTEAKRWSFVTYQKCFVGSEMVDWLMKSVQGCPDRGEAVRLGQKLLDAGIMHHVTKSEQFADEYYFYRFQEDEETSILNMKRVWDSNRKVRHAIDVAQEVITRLACLCEEHRRSVLAGTATWEGKSTPTVEGKSVQSHANSADNSEDIDYALLAKSDTFRQYALSTAELQCVDIANLDTDERLAFFINIYNTLCLHGHVVFGAPTNFLRRLSFFRGMAYRIGGLDYTLDDIEHGILRGNKRPPSFPFRQQLRPTDPKCQYILSRREERIHFVISAGTSSDPPIRIVDMENLEEELHDATEQFLNKTVKVDATKKEVTLPRIFSWYSDDFPRPEVKLLRWVLRYLKSDLHDSLASLIDANGAVPTVIYQNFDWTNSEARFNAGVVRRKRRRLERERAIANVDKNTPSIGTGLISPQLNSFSPAFGGSTGSFNSPQLVSSGVRLSGGLSASGGGPFRNDNLNLSPDLVRHALITGGSSVNTPTVRRANTPPGHISVYGNAAVETPALSGASHSCDDAEERTPGLAVDNVVMPTIRRGDSES